MKKQRSERNSALMTTTTPLPMTAPPKGRPLLQKSLVVLSLGVFGCAEKSKNADEDVKPEINANAEPAREEIVAPKKEPVKPVVTAEPPPVSPFLQGATPPVEPTPPPTSTPQLIATSTTTTKALEPIKTVRPPPPHPGGWKGDRAPHPPPHPWAPHVRLADDP